MRRGRRRGGGGEEGGGRGEGEDGGNLRTQSFCRLRPADSTQQLTTPPPRPLLAQPPTFVLAGAQREEAICTVKLSGAKEQGEKQYKSEGKKSKGTVEMKTQPFYNITLATGMQRGKGMDVVLLTWLLYSLIPATHVSVAAY